MGNAARWMIVTVGALILTTLSINAFDNAGPMAHSMLGSAFVASETYRVCPENMVFVATETGGFCIDAYEAAAGASCMHAQPQNQSATKDNLLLPDCAPVSQPERLPWTNISQEDAQVACERAGKRLPTNTEWYRAALGTPDIQHGWGTDDCNVDGAGVQASGQRAACISTVGAYDMVGNVWEWQDGTINDGVYASTTLPETGYIVRIDETGMPTEIDHDEPSTAFFHDYFWIDAEGQRGMFRGGYWRSRSDAGQFSLNATVPLSFVGAAVGFRCVEDVAVR